MKVADTIAPEDMCPKCKRLLLVVNNRCMMCGKEVKA